MSQDLWCRIARRRAKWAPPTMGPAEYNQTLSVNRALSVNDFLTGKGVSITIWETQADMEATEGSGWYQEQIAKFESVFAGPPVREVYEVSAGEATLGKSEATHARVNYRQIQPDRMDEAISIYQDTVIPAVSAQNGFVGEMVLTGGSSGKLVAIALWESEADMRASQPTGDVDAIAGGPPVREYYEILAQI